MFRVGDRVKHEKRGTGVVTLIDEDTGKTRIRFDGEQVGDQYMNFSSAGIDHLV